MNLYHQNISILKNIVKKIWATGAARGMLKDFVPIAALAWTCTCYERLVGPVGHANGYEFSVLSSTLYFKKIFIHRSHIYLNDTSDLHCVSMTRVMNAVQINSIQTKISENCGKQTVYALVTRACRRHPDH